MSGFRNTLIILNPALSEDAKVAWVNMDFETLKTYLLQKPFTVLDYPFGGDVHVFKVKGKMFALVSHHEGQMNMNLKCDPIESASLRDIFPAIKPGYHMNKKHWITLHFNGSIPQGEVYRLMDNSFQLVVMKLPKRQQALIL